MATPADQRKKQLDPMIEDALKDKAAKLVARDYVANDKAWDSVTTPEFGGQSDILLIEVGEVVGPLRYIGHQPMHTELGETTVHIASSKAGDTLRLPLGATFLRAADQAGLQRDDEFLVKRFEDTIKKKGRGAGNPMPIYAIKVVNRSPRANNSQP